MAITRKKKEKTLEKLNEKFKKANSAVFAGYKGLTVAQLEEARGMMREAGIEYQIAKKRLIKKSLKDALNMEIADDSIMEGPIGVAFGYEDSVSLTKLISKIAKKHKKFVITGGVVDGKGADKNFIEELSKMLSREELLAKFVGMIRSPLYKFSGALNSGLGGFARALKAYAEKQEETN